MEMYGYGSEGPNYGGGPWVAVKDFRQAFASMADKRQRAFGFGPRGPTLYGNLDALLGMPMCALATTTANAHLASGVVDDVYRYFKPIDRPSWSVISAPFVLDQPYQSGPQHRLEIGTPGAQAGQYVACCARAQNSTGGVTGMPVIAPLPIHISSPAFQPGQEESLAEQYRRFPAAVGQSCDNVCNNRMQVCDEERILSASRKRV